MGMPKSWLMGMGWLRLVGSLKLYVSFVEYRALLQKRPMILRGLLQKRPIILKSSFAKETHNFKEPTNRSHPIWKSQVLIRHSREYIMSGESCHTFVT